MPDWFYKKIVLPNLNSSKRERSDSPHKRLSSVPQLSLTTLPTCSIVLKDLFLVLRSFEDLLSFELSAYQAKGPKKQLSKPEEESILSDLLNKLKKSCRIVSV